MPVFGQETPSGLIVEVNSRGEQNIGSLNPLLCNNPNCHRITDLLFPYLLNVDPLSGTFAPATDERGLAESWEIEGDTITYHLRQDRFWTTGTPVTAFDVFYSYLAAINRDVSSPYRETLRQNVLAAAPIDAYTITFVLTDATCSATDVTQIPIIPAFVFDPTFGENAQFLGGDIQEWFIGLPPRDFSIVNNHVFNTEPTVTSGPYRFESRRYNAYIRLISVDGTRAFEYVNAPDSSNATDAFLRGETNLLVNPPYERRQDLRAAATGANPDGIEITTRPGRVALYIGLNVADPLEPLGAYDEEGHLTDQSYHPIFGDVRVRRALQMALDVEALMDVAIEGDGVALATNLPPLSWAVNPDLEPVAYDPAGAARLLEEAGWKDLEGDGIRECITCLYADESALLEFTLIHPPMGNDARLRADAMLNLLAQQWRMVGVSMYPVQQDLNSYPSSLAYQQFDAYIGFEDGYPFNPDQLDQYSWDGDTLETGANVTSYYDDELFRLLFEARSSEHTASCDLDARRDLYHQAQTIVYEDQAYLSLFAPNEIIVTRDLAPDVLGQFWDVVA